VKDQIILVLLVGALLVAGCTNEEIPVTKNPDILDNSELECSRVGGTWEFFGNGCVDSCFKERSEEPPICTDAMTYGCDCGPDRCWNGETCEAN
jgi:hypothetical protein